MKVSEYDEVRITENEEGRHLTHHQFDELNKIQTKLLKNGVIARKFFEFTSKDTIKFLNYAGAVDLGAFTLELMPKVFYEGNDDKSSFLSLARMISYVFGEDLKSSEELLRIEEDGKSEVLQLLIYFYLLALKRSLKHGAFKNYEESIIDDRFLQGRILIERQMAKIDQSRLVQEAFYHTSDTDLMRYFKTVSIFFARIMGSHSMKEELHKLISLLGEVESLKLPNVRNEVFVFNRLNENFRNPYLISKFILNGMAVYPSDSKDSKGVSILFDMNVLFQEFVAELIKRNRKKIFPDNTLPMVYSQESNKTHLFLVDSARSLKPDIRIENESIVPKRVYIIDTKYKDFNRPENQKGPISNVEKEDLYQTYVYSQKYSAEATIIVYPGSETATQFSDYFESGSKFLLWEINFSLVESDWEEKIVSGLRLLFQEIQNPTGS